MSYLSSYEKKCQRVIQRALERQFKRTVILNDPNAARPYYRNQFVGQDRENFVVSYLDSQHRLIETVTHAVGTIDAAAVYPREIVKEALVKGAAAVIFAHNHPSGISEPSSNDRLLTDRLREALRLIDVRVLDHFVVGETVTSFAEKGWI